MKRLLIITAFTSIYFIFGCTETYQVAGPEKPADANRMETVSAEKSIPVSELNWVTKPKRKNALGKTVERKFIKHKKSRRTQFIKVDEWYPGDLFDWTEVYAKIKFKRDTFTKDSFYEDEDYVFSDDGKSVLITLEVDDETCSVTFTPHLMFDKPAILNLEFRGVNLTGVNPEDIEFVYIPEGSEDAFIPKYKSLECNIEEGWIEVFKAELPHFSRFGLIY